MPFWGILLVVAVFVFVSSDPPVVLFGLFVLYGLSGWIIWALRWNRARRLQERRGQGMRLPQAAFISCDSAAYLGSTTKR